MELKERQLQLAAKFFKRTRNSTEGVEYDQKVLVELINKHFPDWRRVLNEVNDTHVGKMGKFDRSYSCRLGFSNLDNDPNLIEDLIKNLKQKKTLVMFANY